MAICNRYDIRYAIMRTLLRRFACGHRHPALSAATSGNRRRGSEMKRIQIEMEDGAHGEQG
jgi:2-methylcitrate dehydratase PrpD